MSSVACRFQCVSNFILKAITKIHQTSAKWNFEKSFTSRHLKFDHSETNRGFILNTVTDNFKTFLVELDHGPCFKIPDHDCKTTQKLVITDVHYNPLK